MPQASSSFLPKNALKSISVPHSLPGACSSSVFLLMHEKGVSCYPQAAKPPPPVPWVLPGVLHSSSGGVEAEIRREGQAECSKLKYSWGQMWLGEEKRSSGPVQPCTRRRRTPALNSHSFLHSPPRKYLRVCTAPAAPPCFCSCSLCIPGVGWQWQGKEFSAFQKVSGTSL